LRLFVMPVQKSYHWLTLSINLVLKGPQGLAVVATCHRGGAGLRPLSLAHDAPSATEGPFEQFSFTPQLLTSSLQDVVALRDGDPSRVVGRSPHAFRRTCVCGPEPVGRTRRRSQCRGSAAPSAHMPGGSSRSRRTGRGHTRRAPSGC